MITARVLLQGLSIQYCMCYPRHVIQSAEVPSVTQMRVSQDYTAGNDQWRVGITSMLAYALALAPSKDTFWTTEAQNSGVSMARCDRLATCVYA